MVNEGQIKARNLTFEDVQRDVITELARKHWASHSGKQQNFDLQLVNHIYNVELSGSQFDQRKIALLEISQYLEKYLWPNFTPSKCTREYLLSIVIMLNEKSREKMSSWKCLVENPSHFSSFFRNLLELYYFGANSPLNFIEQSLIVTFLDICFNSQEVDVVRHETSKIGSILIWKCLLPVQLSDQLERNSKLKIVWKKLLQIDASNSAEDTKKREIECRFLWKLLQDFISVLQNIYSGDMNAETALRAIHFLERCLELFIDLEALLSTRRFFNPLLHSSNLLTYCTLSSLIKSEEGDLFCQLVTMLKFYAKFEVDDVTGEPLTMSEVMGRHYEHIKKLQKAAFMYFRETMKEFYLLNISAVDSRKALVKQLCSMSEKDLFKFAEYLHLVKESQITNEIPSEYWKKFLVEVITSHCERRVNQLQQLNDQPLYPTEKIIWDENVIPYDHYTGYGVLALNKLNLQFLTLHDYLLRNFNLFQLESTYEIRNDIEDAVFRMKPWYHEMNPDQIVWGGWARMALPIQTVRITEVAKPLVGEKSPAVVKSDVTISLPSRFDMRSEWEGLRKHDVCFLIKCKPSASVGTKYDPKKLFGEQIQVTYVRGCEIEGMLDSTGAIIEEFSALEKKPFLEGNHRTYRVWLDENQYRLDSETDPEKAIEEIYHSFNLIVRRDPKTNNFKAVLATIRQLLNTECVVPDWIHDIILGHGDPNAAHYKLMNNAVPTLNFCDTFLSYKHLLSSFPDRKIVTKCTSDDELIPPFRLTFKELETQYDVPASERDCSIVVEPYVMPCRGPYPHVEPRKNAIKFTRAQIEAIKSGMQPGLTMVVGPPGAGKTDVAVQIISNIYHNWPEQRTLIVTHSNQALNQLFEKIIALDVDERHLLRLGHGEEALETEKDFSRYGRVNYVLKTRLELLKQVEKLEEALGVAGGGSYSCENAGNFFLYQVFARWEKFESEIVRSSRNLNLPASIIAENFPFTKYFDDAPQPLFKGISYEEDLEVADGCWRYIKEIFNQLEEFRSFELLRLGRDRTDYLLIKEAKIIAMTCTHAALRRKDLVELGFRYDNILMEEAAQILEVETFVPLLLQNPQDGRNRLKRWIMIGDHHQLPPVVQNVAFQKYSNMEQSLFSRFFRLGVPYVILDQQGRSRSEIADLYNWRYENLGNLPHVLNIDEYNRMNSGFAFNYQFIDVPDFNGIGEEMPSPYFFQNLGEAEYAVALFTYMRILGYPSEKISIITTYNGQASLLRDIIQKRCAENPLIGTPFKISTVDKYQGQQNDYIILSLVRTKHIGHIRDVRRLVVALSRARLGLYVLGRAELYRNCLELAPAFNKLCLHPLKLVILPSETFPSRRKIGTEDTSMLHIKIEDTVHMCEFVHELYLSNVEQLKAGYESHMKDYYLARKAAMLANVNELAGAENAPEVEEQKVPTEPVPEDVIETDITFETMDFELQDPEKLGK